MSRRYINYVKVACAGINQSDSVAGGSWAGTFCSHNVKLHFFCSSLVASLIAVSFEEPFSFLIFHCFDSINSQSFYFQV